MNPDSPPLEERSVKTRSASETREIGARLGGLLETGDFVGLVGDLGAGKTEFVRGAAEGAGVDRSQVASPTFAIVYPYEGGRVPIFHADLYRVADYHELYATGFMDLVGSGATIVEWIDRIWDAAPDDALVVVLTTPPGQANRRDLIVRAYGPRSGALLRDWLG